MSLTTIIKQHVPFVNFVERPEDAFPVNSQWQIDRHDDVLTFEVLGHAVYEGDTLIMCVSYLRWHSVWGWVDNGRAEWLELAIEDGEYVLYTYTDGLGIEIPREWFVEAVQS